MLSVRAALEEVLAHVSTVGHEQVCITQAAGRVLARSVVATRTVPPFDNCAMDGFAVRTGDLAGATPEKPVRLRLAETLFAGSLPSREVEPGTTVQVMTGAPVPPGADAVVKLEDTQLEGGWVVFSDAPRAGQHIRRAGEDLREGDTVWDPGRTLCAADIGVLASLGITSVTVYRRPRVSILATGNELVPFGDRLTPGKIANSNAYALAAAVREAGAESSILGIVPDDLELAQRAFREALEHSDVVVSTGGVSVGALDLVRRVLQALGVRERFWKVRQKPGKPLSFGTFQRTLVFGLPGNPVSALVCFFLYVRPALLRAGGAEEIFFPVIQARAEEDIQGSGGLTDFVRCRLHCRGGQFSVRPLGNQSSGVLHSLSLGNALAILKEEQVCTRAGDKVAALYLGPPTVASPPV